MAALVVIVLAIVGGGGYYLWSQRANAGPALTNEATSTPQVTKAAAQGTATVGANATASSQATKAATASPQATKAATATPKATAKASPTKSGGTTGGTSDIGGIWDGTMVLNSLTVSGLTADEEKQVKSDFESQLKNQEQPFVMTFEPSSSTQGLVVLDSGGDALDPVAYKYQNGQVTLSLTSEGVEFVLSGKVSKSGSDTVLSGTIKATATDGTKTVVMGGTFSVTKQ